MGNLVYFTGDVALVDNLSVEECMAIQEPLKKLAKYERLEKQGLIQKPIDKDLFKAMRCLASQNAYGNMGECHMEIWNRFHEHEDGYKPMKCGEYEDSVCCPFYQKKIWYML